MLSPRFWETRDQPIAGWAVREALPVSIKFTHNTIRNYSTTIFYADTAVITTETDTVSMSKNVTASYFCFLALIHLSEENVQVDIKRDPWQGRRKHQKIGEGGTGFQGHFWILKRAPKKIFPGGKENIPFIPYRNCTFLTKLFLKASKFPNKKGTFDFNLVFTATLASLYKKGTFHHKKDTFGPLKKWGGGARAACVSPPPRFLCPLSMP